MKIRRYLLFAFAAVTMGFVQSCDLERSDNGDYDGLWQLTAVDTIATNGHKDMLESNISWCIQGSLLELMYINTGYSYFCRFNQADGVLTIDGLRKWSKDEQDPLVTDVTDVQRFGVNDLPEQFQILTINKGTMVLQSPLLRLNFRKY